MAIFKNNPPIVTNGLVLYVDAANKISYPGTGTTWSDLSGNGVNGTLQNGPTFNSANGGSIVFDGSNDYVNLPYNTNYNFTTITSLIWIKTPIQYTGGYRIVISKQSFNIHDRDFNFYIASPSSNGVISQLHFSTARLTTYNGFLNTSLSLDSWYQVGFSLGNGFLNYILNGQIIHSSTTTGDFNASSNYNINIGRADSHFLGNVGNTLLYNRALSQQEIQQNYNATKTRFGLT